MEIAITGIRYKLQEVNGYTDEERDGKCEEFVAGIELGETLLLVAEPDNAVDPLAIAAYCHYYSPIGYVARELTRVVHPALAERGFLEVHVVRKSEHTLFADIPEANGHFAYDTFEQDGRISFPHCDKLRMEFTIRERQSMMLERIMLDNGNDISNIDTLLNRAEDYLRVQECSLCADSANNLNSVKTKFQQLAKVATSIPLDDVIVARINGIVSQINSRQKYRKSYVTLFEKELRDMKERSEGRDGLKAKFSFLDKEQQREVIDGCKALYSQLFGTCSNHDVLAKKIAYMRLSRADHYRILAMLVIVEQEGFFQPQEPQSPTLPKGFNDVVLRGFIEAGLLTDGLQPAPNLSRGEKAMLAHVIADRLRMKPFWPFFERFWHMKSLSGAHSKYIATKKSNRFLQRLKYVE